MVSIEISGSVSCGLVDLNAMYGDVILNFLPDYPIQIAEMMKGEVGRLNG